MSIIQQAGSAESLAVSTFSKRLRHEQLQMSTHRKILVALQRCLDVKMNQSSIATATAAHLLTLYSLLIPFCCQAQVPVASHTPHARVLAIGTFVSPPTPEQLQLLSVRLYSTGKIDQWYSPQDGHGIVLILNLPSVKEARAMLEALPFGEPKVMTFELIPLGPPVPWTRLLPHPAEPAQ